MRIGIDLSCWSNRRGFGRFTRSLVTEMVRCGPDEDFVFLIDRPSLEQETVALDGELVAVDVRLAPSEAASSQGRRSIPDLLRMSAAGRRIACDVIFFPATYTYFPVPGTPEVVTVHDAIAEQLPDLILPSVQAKVAWRAKQWMALRRAAAVITVSEASRQAISATMRVPDDNLHVIREAPDPKFRPLSKEIIGERIARFGIVPGDRYLLYVGGISPHKNLGVLIDAFDVLAKTYEDLKLFLVGEVESDPFLSDILDIRRRIADSTYGSRVVLTGYVSDDELVALYSGASATALPSLGEGFGLTAAESAACGTPVVASRDPALMELMGPDALYANATQPAEFVEVFRLLLDDRATRARYSEAVLRRAARWSWGPAAEQVVEILREAARSDG